MQIQDLNVFLDYFDKMHQRTMRVARCIPQLIGKCTTPEGAPITTWLRAMVEHEVHHRGQIYLYLSMLGVPTPPLYGLASDQVRERSLPGQLSSDFGHLG